MLLRRQFFFTLFFVFISTDSFAQILEFDLHYQRTETAREDHSAETGVTYRPARPPQDVDETHTVTLTPTAIWVREPALWRIYDLEAKTLTYVRPQANYYAVSALHWLPAFNDFEKMHRRRSIAFARERGSIKSRTARSSWT